MALITISGYPCSGKSRRASQIKSCLEDRLRDPAYLGTKFKVVIVSDDSLSLSRSAYDESRSEKPARGALFTAIQRQMATDTILIVDSLNYIKGFRYQIYCAAREMKLRICTIYVVSKFELCKEWNAIRKDDRAYAPETLKNLIARYEEPSSMVRWDSPLFTVLWTDEVVPGADIWEVITKGTIKPPNSGTLNVAKAPSDALQILEQTTAAVVSGIMASGSLSIGDAATVILSISKSYKIQICLPPRNITLSELQRFKRQFVTTHKKAITLGTTEKGAVDWGEESVAQKFVMFLEENF